MTTNAYRSTLIAPGILIALASTARATVEQPHHERNNGAALAIADSGGVGRTDKGAVSPWRDTTEARGRRRLVATTSDASVCRVNLETSCVCSSNFYSPSSASSSYCDADGDYFG